MHQHWRLAVIGFCALAISLYVYTWTQTSYNISSVSSYFAPPGNCTPGDPYLLPGMIEWGSSANETRWVPFPSINSPQTPKNSTDLSGSEWESQEKMHADALEGWMESLSKGDPEDQILEEMSWARGKLVIFIDDRNNVQQFCNVVSGEYTSWGGHTGGICRIPQLDLVIAHWFLYGMIDVEDPLWWPGESAPFTFENRISQVMIPKMEAAGLTQKPDLFILASLFWDEGFLNKLQKAESVQTPTQDGFPYLEVLWHNKRFGQLVKFIQDLYEDPGLSLMIRTRQLRQRDNSAGVLKIFQLDQGLKAVARELGMRPFSWAEKLEGYIHYYDGDQHFDEGPNTFLFGDMMLFYLRQATQGCWDSLGPW